MNGALINIWRENSAYLRYAEGKILFLIGVSGAILVSVSVIKTQQNIFSLSLLASETPELKVLEALCFAISVGVGLYSIIPKLSYKSEPSSETKTNNQDLNLEKLNLIYFQDIAKFQHWQSYKSALQAKGENSLKDIDNEVLKQIWIVSRIANMKFNHFCLSLAFLTAGLILFIVELVFYL